MSALEGSMAPSAISHRTFLPILTERSKGLVLLDPKAGTSIRIKRPGLS